MKCYTLITLLLAPPFFSCPALLWAQRGPTSSSRSGVSMEIGIQARNADGTAGPPGIYVRFEAAEGGSADDCVTEQGGKSQFHPNSTGMYVVRVRQLWYKKVSLGVNLLDLKSTRL